MKIIRFNDSKTDIVLRPVNLIDKQDIKNVLLVDNETTNDDKIVFDLSLRVVNVKEKRVLARFSFVIKEVWETNSLIRAKYSKNKIKKYRKFLKTSKYVLISREELFHLLNELIVKYDIKFFCAYNGAFDITALAKTFTLENKRTKYFKSSLPYFTSELAKLDLIDIGTLCYPLYETEEYKHWYDENVGLYCKDGTRKVNCEIMTQYAIRELDFIEEHTGQRDLDVEMQLMLYMLGRDDVQKVAVNLPMTWGVRLFASDKGLSDNSKVKRLLKDYDLDYWFTPKAKNKAKTINKQLSLSNEEYRQLHKINSVEKEYCIPDYLRRHHLQD